MLLFLDDTGRLYAIFVDTNKKQTWVPLPSSRLTMRLAGVPMESAPSDKPGASMMEIQGTEQRLHCQLEREEDD